MSHFRLVQDWLEGWNSRNPDRIMAHYAEDAVFQSPSVLALGGSGDGVVRGKKEITEFTRRAFERFPKLRFEVEDVIERPQPSHRDLSEARRVCGEAGAHGRGLRVRERSRETERRLLERGGGREPVSGTLILIANHVRKFGSPCRARRR